MSDTDLIRLQQMLQNDGPNAQDGQNPVFCPRCRVQVRETDHYCYNCGRSLKRGYGFVYTHTGIILMALVLGPFALPLVWLSKRIHPAFKIIYTMALVALGYYIVISFMHAYAAVQDAMNNLSNMQDFSSLQGFSTIKLDSF